MGSWISDDQPALGGASGTIGGSNVAGVLGVGRYGDPHKTWQVMTGRLTVEETPAMRRGSVLEDVVSDLVTQYGFPRSSMVYRSANKSMVKPAVRTFYWNDRRFSASVDREIFADVDDGIQLIGIGEMKTMSNRVKFEGGTFDILGQHVTVDVPIGYWLQLQHYMLARGVNMAVLFCLRADSAALQSLTSVAELCGCEVATKVAAELLEMNDAEFHCVRVERHPMYADIVIPYLEEWHMRHIDEDEAPEATASSECRDYILHGERFGELDADGELDELISEAVSIREQIDLLNSEYKATVNAACELMGKSSKARGSLGTITVSEKAERTRFDDKAALAAQPELAEKYSKKVAASKVVTLRKR